jgi:hypothetical protein
VNPWIYHDQIGMNKDLTKCCFLKKNDCLQLFGKKKIHMFTMSKDLTKHFGERVGNEVPAAAKPQHMTQFTRRPYKSNVFDSIPAA